MEYNRELAFLIMRPASVAAQVGIHDVRALSKLYRMGAIGATCIVFCWVLHWKLSQTLAFQGAREFGHLSKFEREVLRQALRKANPKRSQRFAQWDPTAQQVVHALEYWTWDRAMLHWSYLIWKHLHCKINAPHKMNLKKWICRKSLVFHTAKSTMSVNSYGICKHVRLLS